jgi:UDP-glucuronate 4-epimerase
VETRLAPAISSEPKPGAPPGGRGAPVLVTGAAGFIGFHVARKLLQAGRAVAGLDSMNSYYDVALKEGRRAELAKSAAFRFHKLDLADRGATAALFAEHRFAYVVHFAAQAGVRHSFDHPFEYVDANLQGFANVLEGCRHHGCLHLLFASSSSVYGANTRLPFRTSDNVDHPLNLYGATKKANELMAHAYSHLFGLPATGLRLFTVYGPWGRPDMAVWRFTEAILRGQPIQLFGGGRLRRDFTYVDDVAEAVVRLVDRIPHGDPAWSGEHPDPASSIAPWRIYNIGNHSPVEVLELVDLIEQAVGRKAERQMLPLQPGEVAATYADVDDLTREVGFRPATPLKEGVAKFVAWYRDYHRF